jgi:hypothetical protein
MSNWLWYVRIWIASRFLGKQYYFYLVEGGQPEEGEIRILPIEVPDAEAIERRLT